MAEFFDALNLVVLVIDYVMLYRLFYPNIVQGKIIAIIIITIIAFLLLVPFPLLAWLLFFALFLQGFFKQFRPWKW